jgi:hypothetical protein
MRTLIVFVFIAVASICGAQQSQPLQGKELAEFLGPVSPHTFRWSKYTMIDFELYNGEAMPPLSGHVGFYLGGHPDFQRTAGSKQIKGHLGRYPVTWYRAVDEHGVIGQVALIPLDNYWQIDLSLSAKQQADIDQIITTIARLPVFTNKPKPVFSGNKLSSHPW